MWRNKIMIFSSLTRLTDTMQWAGHKDRGVRENHFVTYTRVKGQAHAFWPVSSHSKVPYTSISVRVWGLCGRDRGGGGGEVKLQSLNHNSRRTGILHSPKRRTR
jgi:hypothetical protein